VHGLVGEGVLVLRAGGDVADEGHGQQAPGRLEAAEGDVDGELGDVLAAAGQLQPGAHDARRRLPQVALPVADVGSAQMPGEQDLHELADQLVPGVPNSRSVWPLTSTVTPSASAITAASGADRGGPGSGPRCGGPGPRSPGGR
jgi:hypothetical protein